MLLPIVNHFCCICYFVTIILYRVFLALFLQYHDQLNFLSYHITVVFAVMNLSHLTYFGLGPERGERE